jgi:hypothetical protein
VLHGVDLHLEPNEASDLAEVHEPGLLEAHGWDHTYLTVLDAGCKHCASARCRWAAARSATLVHDVQDLRTVEGVADGPDGHAMFVIDVESRVDMRFLLVD